MAIVRAAMTETCNAYQGMPKTVDELPTLRSRLGEIREANVTHNIELIETARRAGARIIGLGELFTAPYFALRSDEFWREMAEDIETGPTIATLRRTAAAQEIVIVAPIFELDGDRRFNTAVVIDADGRILGRYRKSHIPIGANESARFDEAFYYDRSEDADLRPVFDTSVGRLGVAICYDRHFEGMISGLADKGAQLIFSPAVTFGARSRRMWDLEFEVEASRHRVFIGGSNRRGSEAPWNQEFFGASHFVGPEGRLENRSEHPNLVLADLDLTQLGAADSAGWDLPRDRRL